MKKVVVLVGEGKKSLILDLLKENSINKKDLSKVSKEERRNKVMSKAKKLIETNPEVFIN